MKHKINLDNILPFLEDKLHIKFESLIDKKGMLVRQSGDSLVIDPDDEQCVIVKMSDISTDRSGEVLVPEGCDFRDYMKNPINCWDHNYSLLPFSKTETIQINDKGVFGKIKFGTAERCKEVYNLVKEGILSAVSVGFVANEVLKKGTKQFNDFVRYNSNRLKNIENIEKIITRWTLLELSWVNVPCNQNAIVIAKNIQLSPEMRSLLKIKDITSDTFNNEIGVNVNVENFESFERENLEKDIDCVYGLKDGIKSLHSIRFNGDNFNEETIKLWLKNNNYNVDNKEIEVAPEKIEDAGSSPKESFPSTTEVTKPSEIIPNEVADKKDDEEKEVIALIRVAVQSEQDAINQYDKIISESKNEDIKKVVSGIKDDERKHTGELQTLINILNGDEIKKVEEGRLEVEKELNNAPEKIETNETNEVIPLTLEKSIEKVEIKKYIKVIKAPIDSKKLKDLVELKAKKILEEIRIKEARKCGRAF